MKNYVDAKALQEYTTKLVAKLKTLFPGTPTAAATVAEMTDHSKTYVYVGTESGYTAGDWYYWNGTAWASGGPFQATSIITDTTLAVAGEAADAKATGDAIAAAKTAVLNAMAPAYSTSGTYAVGDYVNHNGAIYRCTTAITTGEAWTAGHWAAVTLGADLEDQVGTLKESFNITVMEKYGVSSRNVLEGGDASLTQGYIDKSNVEHSASRIVYTDYIPVKPGYVLRAYFIKQGVHVNKYFRFVCAYNAEKSVISSAGSNTSIAPYTVPDGVYFVRLSIDGYVESGSIATTNFQISVNTQTSEYYPYEPVSYTIAEDFLTEETKQQINENIENIETLEGVLSNLSPNDLQYPHAVSLPHRALLQTVGISETWYYKSAVTPYSPTFISAGSSYSNRYNDKCEFPNESAVSASNGFNWYVYTELLTLLESERGSAGIGRPRRIIVENLPNITMLVLGDSTVARGVMTQTMLDYYTSKNKTLTLLGTVGSGDNKTEGRSGWSASDYVGNTERGRDTAQNPFYNPNSGTFDFSYYMNAQGYNAPDYVIVQLGINDLYNNYSAENIENTWTYINTIIDSIASYNANIKILVNLPTTPNSKQEEHSNIEFLYRNAIIKYCAYAMNMILNKNGNVKYSYVHLILDPDNDISDNVHPTNAGFAKMGMEVINQVNCWNAGY